MNKTELLNKLARDNGERLLLARALDKLEEPDRSLVIRFYFYGEKTSALAKACGLTDTAVRLRLHRSRGKLRKYMIERGFDHAE